MSTQSGTTQEISPPRPVAVVDIGATSIRMAIAEISGNGEVELLESLSKPVDLGKDTFTSRRIRKSSIEDCVKILKSYKKLLDGYGIQSAEQIRVVATSAVREATNRLAFLDRIYIATGVDVEPLDEAEVNRITYMGIQSQLQADPKMASRRCMIVEVGGGSTEVLEVQAGNVLFSNTYRLGSLRLREALDRLDALVSQQRMVLETHITRFSNQIHEHITTEQDLQLVCLGSEMRFAAKHLIEDWDHSNLAFVAVSDLAELTDQIIDLTEDQVVQRFGVTYQEAETLGPALMSFRMLAEKFDQTQLVVSDTNLREGLLQDMAIRDVWTANFRSQIIRSAIQLGRRFHFDESHARHVATLCRKLFAELHAEHQLDPRFELLLYLAALLHEIGQYINARSNHKHAMYLIRHSELFGLSRKDVLLVALVARYHRRSSPQPQHDGYSTLGRDDRVAVCKLAAMLRVAIALDDSRSQRIADVQCRLSEQRLLITAKGVEDVSLEQLALRQSGNLFQETFGLPVQLRAGAG